MNFIEVYRQIRIGFLVAFIITAPALISVAFHKFQVPYFHFYDEVGTISLHRVVIIGETFYAFLVQKANVFLTYFPPSFIFGIYIGHLYKSQSKETVLRGLKRVKPKEMAKVIKKVAKEQAKRFGYSPAYRIILGGVPIPYAMEAQSFLFLGQAGSGKTQAMLQLTEQIKNFGETIIAYDRKPDYYTRYYREGKDYLFYPKDARSISFNLLDQISEDTAYEDITFIASNIIPNGNRGSDEHWIASARSVLKAVLVTLFFNTNRSNKAMVKFLRENQGAKKLREMIQSFPDAERWGIDITATLSADKDGNTDSQGNSVFSTVNLYLEPLRNEVFISDNEPFSIRDFIWANEHENQDIRLFLVQTTKEQDAYTVWFRTFLGLLSREIRSLPNRLDRRIHILLDEAQSLGKFSEIVNDLPAEARSKGAVLSLATQSLSAVKEIYGNELMQSVLANTKTKFVFTLGDPFSQHMMETYFGKVEIEEQKESFSSGSGLDSNRTNTSTSVTTKSAVMGVEFLALKPLHAFIQIDEYVSKVEFTPITVPEINSFQPKSKEAEISAIRLKYSYAWSKTQDDQERSSIAANFENELELINHPEKSEYSYALI